LLTHKHHLGLITINIILTKYPKTKAYGKLTKNSPSSDQMLGMLLATPNHTKPRENTKLNSFLQDLTKTSKRCGLTIYLKKFGQNVDRASRITLSKSDIRLDGWISRYYGF